MKKKETKIIIVSVAILVIVVLFLRFNNTLSLTQSCEYGHWTVDSYDMSKGEIKISGGVNNLNNAGCLDAHSVRNPEIGLKLDNQADCELIYGVGSWRDDGNFKVCQLVNENWMNGKTVTYFGTCINVCENPAGCGVNNPYGSSVPFDYTGTFDGTIFSFGGTSQASLKQTCTGGAIVKFKDNECISGQKLCSDGVCRTNCEEPVNYLVIFIAILVFVGIIYGLFKLWRKK